MPTSSFTPVLPPYTRFLPVHPSSLVSVGACSIAGGSLRQGRSLATDSEDNEASGKLFHQKTDKDSGPLGGARSVLWTLQRTQSVAERMDRRTCSGGRPVDRTAAIPG
ncbi:hypothetical protein C0Q70_08273 [Pomacea canaliculata]|uniref:Uncharacterized protein n=1 Tax=Pomacea canaliculata TaxID=400727 RepID=A0A2T7PHC4_POMCA|nr:hypothetical protein C0Q70_08273 [Pomacea canaliculata]